MILSIVLSNLFLFIHLFADIVQQEVEWVAVVLFVTIDIRLHCKADQIRESHHRRQLLFTAL